MAALVPEIFQTSVLSKKSSENQVNILIYAVISSFGLSDEDKKYEIMMKFESHFIKKRNAC